jgi:DnaJ-domain-containing protein 1
MAAFRDPGNTKLEEARIASPHSKVMLILERKSRGEDKGSASEEQDWEKLKFTAMQRLNDDLYTALKLKRQASQQEIKKAYRQMSLKCTFYF